MSSRVARSHTGQGDRNRIEPWNAVVARNIEADSPIDHFRLQSGQLETHDGSRNPWHCSSTIFTTVTALNGSPN